MKVGLISLGCAKNLVDSEMVLGLLKKEGYEITPFPDLADLIIVNTCGFIQSAKEEAISTIFEMIKIKKDHQKLVVIGCLAERYKDELIKEIPEVDRFITIKEYASIGTIIGEVMANNKQIEGLDFHTRILSTPSFTAYVRIGDGCDNRCAYCAIPLIRGPFNSRPIEDVVLECKELLEKGIKEIVLIAQDTTRFGVENGENIEDLLLRIVKLPGLKMLRLLYLYPDEISNRLIDIFASNPLIAPYFDIPIQHASDKILALMNRRGTQQDIRLVIDKIRQKIPQAIIRTTVMVGFPFETEEDYQVLEDFIDEIGFDRLGVFTYSPEEDTPAFEYPNQVEEEIKKSRYDRLMKVQMKVAYRKSKEKIGQIYQAFIEGYDANMKKFKARSYAFAGDDADGFIYVESTNLLKIGSEVKVKITGNYIYDLIGEIIE